VSAVVVSPIAVVVQTVKVLHLSVAVLPVNSRLGEHTEMNTPVS